MRYCLFTILFFLFLNSSAQNSDYYSKDTLFDSGIFISGTVYSFAYSSTDLKNGSTAAGISLFLNDELINLQIGIMVDLKKYYEWSGGHYNPHWEERTDFFFPITLHYNYLRLRKTVYFFSLGIIPGKNFYLDESNYTLERNGVPVYCGIGISHYILKRLYMRVSVNTQYVDKIFCPGLSLDLAFKLDK